MKIPHSMPAASVVGARSRHAALGLFFLLMLVVTLALAAGAGTFDRSHADWTALTSKHVHWNATGTATTVDYAGFKREGKALDAYLAALAKVPEVTFRSWPKADRTAFLINAYNAATVKLVLTRYPNLESIKELGGLFNSPWKKMFVDLLGERRSLDGIEHGLLRGAQDYDDPRIHFAVNCASIGCPALRPEAYVGARLDAQLADQTRRFLRDRTRNRLHDDDPLVASVSSIFDWYREDFDRAGGLGAFLADHGDALAASPAQVKQLRKGRFTLDPPDYDWRLNDIALRDAR